MGSKSHAHLITESKKCTQNAVHLLEQVKEINREIKENPGCAENSKRLLMVVEIERQAFALSRQATELYSQVIG